MADVVAMVVRVSLLVFLTIGAHHELLRAAVLSFQLLPPAGPDVILPRLDTLAALIESTS